eukprot:CAMPEP_0185573540 /NCGR_PEP_ID=MMETSP0434-20130131/5214_1 /TAXON_ID=626734 ORGANISM="Favella taraikaensis, Strain Fe Narragansett Bay" /NCGR_SAMPLE_ID=MMETSP0434 /ASSEMBLY_ACC=CAM_ASM_000379 /LENGTH=73 /DNA_ID=CAMNT_0028189791 /DNA_START=804 /DNA_END=1025 /DNA_ORIENTATION=+
MLNVVDEQTTETDGLDSLSQDGPPNNAGSLVENCEVSEEDEKLKFKLAPCFSQKLPIYSILLSVEQQPTGPLD